MCGWTNIARRLNDAPAAVSCACSGDRTVRSSGWHYITAGAVIQADVPLEKFNRMPDCGVGAFVGCMSRL